jgi:hypothetical protein
MRRRVAARIVDRLAAIVGGAGSSVMTPAAASTVSSPGPLGGSTSAKPGRDPGGAVRPSSGG